MSELKAWLDNLPPDKRAETLASCPGLEDYLGKSASSAPASKGGKSKLEEKLADKLALLGDRIPPPEREYRFHPVRRFRFDFAWPEQKIAAEVQGGQWIRGGGRHQRGSSLDNEYTKMNLAILSGWRVFLFSTNMINDGSAAATLYQAFGLAPSE